VPNVLSQVLVHVFHLNIVTIVIRCPWLLFNAKWAAGNSIIARKQITFQGNDDDVHFVQDQHALMDLSKQQSMCRHVALHWHIILIPSQQAFALSP